MTMERAALDHALIAAHEAHDVARLIRLYTQAADAEEAAGRVTPACFYLTQAFVFALEAGSARADALNERLHRHGRDARLAFSESGEGWGAKARWREP